MKRIVSREVALGSFNWIEDDEGLFDKAMPLSDDARQMLRTLDGVCGTPSGWYGHRQAGEIPCSDCTAAHTREPGKPTVIRDSCGSAKGWADHRYRSELACPDCTEAKHKADAAKCGSYAGFMLHRRKKESPCAGCSLAAFDRKRARERPWLEQAVGEVLTCPACGRSVARQRPYRAPVKDILSRHKTALGAGVGAGWCEGSLGPGRAAGSADATGQLPGFGEA